MKARVLVDWAAIVALPLVSLGALLFLGGSVDRCLSPGPSWGADPGRGALRAQCSAQEQTFQTAS